jgi:hypothetical protein
MTKHGVQQIWILAGNFSQSQPGRMPMLTVIFEVEAKPGQQQVTMR